MPAAAQAAAPTAAGQFGTSRGLRPHHGQSSIVHRQAAPYVRHALHTNWRGGWGQGDTVTTQASGVRPHPSPWQRRVLSGIAVALVYVIAGRLGLLLAVPPGYATAIFPPAGIAVAAAFSAAPICAKI